MLDVSIIKSCSFLVLVIFQTSCALHYTDREGNNHNIGFVSVKSGKSNCVVTNAVKSFGLSIDFTPDSGGINLGMRSISKSYIQYGDYVELEESDTESLLSMSSNSSLHRSKEACVDG